MNRRVIFAGFVLGLCLTGDLFGAGAGKKTSEGRDNALSILQKKFPDKQQILKEFVAALSQDELDMFNTLESSNNAYDIRRFGLFFIIPLDENDSAQGALNAMRREVSRETDTSKKLSSRRERKVEVAAEQQEEKKQTAAVEIGASRPISEANQTMPVELHTMMSDPRGIPGIIFSIEEEITLGRFSTDHILNFAYYIWQASPQDIRKVLIDSGSMELTRQARMVFLRIILAKIREFYFEPAGQDKKTYQKDVVRITAEKISQKIGAVVKDVHQHILEKKVNIPDFVGKMLTFIEGLDSDRENLGEYGSPDIKVSNSRLFHAAMLTRLASMLDNASTNVLEREYLYDLLADSLLQNGMQESYKRLARLVSMNHRALAMLYLIPTLIPFTHYTLYPSLKLLQEKAQNLGISGIVDPLEVSKRVEAFAAHKQPTFFVGMKAAEELVEIFEVATKEENFAARNKLIALLRATEDEHMRQEYAVLHHKPSVSQLNKLRLNELIRLAFIFGPQHAYENLNASLGALERSWNAKPDPTMKTEWKALLEKFTLDYWTPETLSMGKKIKLDSGMKGVEIDQPVHRQIVSKIKRIRRLRSIFDYAGNQKDEDAQRFLIYILHEVAKPMAAKERLDQYIYLADAFSDQEGYKRLLAILEQQSRLSRIYSAVATKVPFQKSLLAQWHAAIEELYKSGRVLISAQ